MKYLESFNYFKNINELSLKLKAYNINIDYWGIGDSKTVKHLFDELKYGDCFLKDEGGYLVRYIEFVGIKVFYKDKNGQLYLLKEDRQEFKDGRIRRRNLESSVSEKIKSGEDVILSAIRGIKEELNLEINKNQLKSEGVFDYNRGSVSYPGLKTVYKGHHFICYLNDEQYIPNGYIERQKDKSTFFIWTKVEK